MPLTDIERPKNAPPHAWQRRRRSALSHEEHEPRHSVWVAKSGDATSGPSDAALLRLYQAIASRDLVEVTRMLDSAQAFATTAIRVAASRQDPETYFLTAIRHYVYGGDTGLHVAAAAHERAVA